MRKNQVFLLKKHGIKEMKFSINSSMPYCHACQQVMSGKW